MQITRAADQADDALHHSQVRAANSIAGLSFGRNSNTWGLYRTNTASSYKLVEDGAGHWGLDQEPDASYQLAVNGATNTSSLYLGGAQAVQRCAYMYKQFKVQVVSNQNTWQFIYLNDGWATGFMTVLSSGNALRFDATGWFKLTCTVNCRSSQAHNVEFQLVQGSGVQIPGAYLFMFTNTDARCGVMQAIYNVANPNDIVQFQYQPTINGVTFEIDNINLTVEQVGI